MVAQACAEVNEGFEEAVAHVRVQSPSCFDQLHRLEPSHLAVRRESADLRDGSGTSDFKVRQRKLGFKVPPLKALHVPLTSSRTHAIMYSNFTCEEKHEALRPEIL